MSSTDDKASARASGRSAPGGPGGPGRNAAVTQLTRATYERLQDELDDLTTRGRVEIARAIEAARALGDLSENGDYHAAKDTQGKMEARIRHLKGLLEKAVIVEGSEVNGDGTASVGTVVELRYGDDEDTEHYFIGSIEEDRLGVTVVSPGSPLGQALIGHAAGERVSYDAPGGSLEVQIVAIRPGS